MIFRSLRNTRPDARFEDVAHLVRGAQGRVLLETGDLDAGLICAGQVQGLIRDIPTVAELIRRIMAEATDIISRRLAGFLSDRPYASASA